MTARREHRVGSTDALDTEPPKRSSSGIRQSAASDDDSPSVGAGIRLHALRWGAITLAIVMIGIGLDIVGLIAPMIRNAAATYFQQGGYNLAMHDALYGARRRSGPDQLSECSLSAGCYSPSARKHPTPNSWPSLSSSAGP